METQTAGHAFSNAAAGESYHERAEYECQSIAKLINVGTYPGLTVYCCGLTFLAELSSCSVRFSQESRVVNTLLSSLATSRTSPGILRLPAGLCQISWDRNPGVSISRSLWECRGPETPGTSRHKRLWSLLNLSLPLINSSFLGPYMEEQLGEISGWAIFSDYRARALWEIWHDITVGIYYLVAREWQGMIQPSCRRRYGRMLSRTLSRLWPKCAILLRTGRTWNMRSERKWAWALLSPASGGVRPVGMPEYHAWHPLLACQTFVSPRCSQVATRQRRNHGAREGQLVKGNKSLILLRSELFEIADIDISSLCIVWTEYRLCGGGIVRLAPMSPRIKFTFL